MSLLHAEALAMIDALEARLKEMEFPDPRRGTITVYDPFARSLEALRTTIHAWYEAEYRSAHPDDPRCIHGIEALACPRHGGSVEGILPPPQVDDDF